MDAHARIEAELVGGRTVPRVLRSSPPLTLRATAAGVHVVGSAAGPLGGDRLHLDIVVGPGADLGVHSVAAQLVQPGPRDASSSMSVAASVGEGGRLWLLPAPVVVVAGARHQATSTLELAEDAIFVVREELVLGRHREPGGSILSRLRIDRAGRPVLRTDLALGPAWSGSSTHAVTGGHRVIGHVVAVGTGMGPLDLVAAPDMRLAATAFGQNGILVTAVGDRADRVTHDLDAVVAALRAGVTARRDPTVRSART